jgi:hypothetical protein
MAHNPHLCVTLLWARHVARMVEGRGVHSVLVGKPFGRPRRRWDDNIKLDLQEVGGSCGEWMELAQDRDRWRALVSTVKNHKKQKTRGISWLAAEPVSFSRRTLLHGVSKCHPVTCRSLAVYLFRKLRDIFINYASVSINCRLFSSDFDHIWMGSTVFWYKSFQYQVGQNTVQWEPNCSIRTDRRTWRS